MELTAEIKQVVKQNLLPIQSKLEELGYNINQPLAHDPQSLDKIDESMTIEFFNSKENITCGITIHWVFPTSLWKFLFELRKEFSRCHLDLLMPELKAHNDPSVITFKHDENLNVLDANMKKAVQSLLEIMNSKEFLPILKGEKWIEAKIVLPDEYF